MKDGRNASETRGRQRPYPELESFNDRRQSILNELRYKTTGRFPRDAVNTFLDNFQAIDLVLKAATGWGRSPSGSYYTSRSPSRRRRLTSQSRYRFPGIRTRQIATPSIQHMSWKQWSSRRRRRSFDTLDYSAIDVLDEEAQPRILATRRRTLLSAISNGVSGSSNGQIHAHSRGDGASIGSKPLPSRVRINSLPIKRILDSMCDDDLLIDRYTDALIIVRPFKLLSHNEGEIRERMGEIESLHQERLNLQAALERSADQGVPASGTEVLDTVNENIPDENATTNNEGGAGRPATDDEDQEEDDRSSLSRRSIAVVARLFGTGTDWSKLADAEIKEARDDFRCLVRFIDETLMPVRRYLQAQPKDVNFDNIWHLYSAGSLVYVRERSIPQKIWKIVQATGGRRYQSEPMDRIPGWESKFSPCVLDCYHLDFDGTKFVRVYHRFTIEVFEEPVLVSNLQVMPLAVAEKAGLANVEHLRRRGMEFLSYTKPSSSQHREYHGVTITHSPSGEPLYRKYPDEIGSQRLFTERVDSQVVVDFERAIRANPEWGPVSNDIDLFKIDPAELEGGPDDVEKDHVWDARASDDLLKKEQEKWQRWDKYETSPEGDDVLMFPNRVFGYVLRTRSWGT